jgi:hypothetical protein
MTRIKHAVGQRWAHFLSNQRWKRISRVIYSKSLNDLNQKPVILFNASTRLESVSQNAAYSLLTGLGLRANGTPVINFVCRGGLQRCVLGSNRDDYTQSPPCDHCIRQSKQVFFGSQIVWLEPKIDSKLIEMIKEYSLDDLSKCTYQNLNLGFWAINSLRWVLRRYTLTDDTQTREFLKAYILSGWNVYQQFSVLLDAQQPQAVVIFNGMFFPEAAARQACLERGIRVITHEVGIQPFSAFFTTGEATAYPMEISDNFEFSNAMNNHLDDYLTHRFQGNFSMAGIKFWPQIKQLDEELLTKISRFEKIVPVFTNVIFDTSQVHANTLFPDMFAWLQLIKDTALAHPEIVFIIRAHPDEGRKGKESRESVADWVRKNTIESFPNVVFINSDEYVSSYDLIQRAHFVMVYNSTIGLEAVLMGKVVLTAAKARFTQLPITVYPASLKEYEKQLSDLLSSDAPQVSQQQIKNARKFIYKQLFISSLPFERFLKADKYWKGYVSLTKIYDQDLLRENSETMKVLLDGILANEPFEMTA